MSRPHVGRPTGRRNRSRRSAWVVAGFVALVALASGSVAGAARGPAPSGLPGAFTPAQVPLGMSNKPTTVVVELAADPVTVADANSAVPLTREQRHALKDQLRAQQAPVADQIRSRGGKVLATYQSSYNGIKVQTTAKDAAGLASLPGVVAVHPLKAMRPDNVHGVPLVGGPAVWGGTPGFAGENIKIAVIDTGIDYTHADFGGSGNPADFEAASAASTLPANPMWFGPNAPRVKGGIDLVGDDYDASPDAPPGANIPHPDPNPLDCQGHGSHTAGTAAGSGVLGTGATYTGPYNASTISSHTWNVGPGVAPKADIYSIRVFGCTGSTDVTIDAIEWAVDNDMDVINMSLGSPYGSPDDPGAQASTNAAKDGVIVIASSGNAGSNPYITGTPASGTGVVSVAASDPNQSFPGANLTLTKADATSGGTRQAIVANGFEPLPAGPFNLKVIFSAPNVISLGCSVAADQASGPILPNTYIVVARGTCARVAKAIFGQQAGAAGVIMVNNAGTLPPFEGKITSNPDTGQPYDVTIPFLGTAGGTNPSTSAAGVQFRAADGGTISLASIALTNSNFLGLASFTSWGPASGDSSLKPNVTAPGVSIQSVGVGTGTGLAIMSGTSMAAPHTAGTAALVRQAHPDWRKVKYWSAAIENTADPGMVTGFAIRGAGGGFIQALPAVQTNVVALGDDNAGSLSYGFAELSKDFSEKDSITLKNLGNSPATFTVSDQLPQGVPHTTTFSASTITVPAHGDRELKVRLSVPATTAGGGVVPCAGVTCASTPFNEASGLVTLTPSGGSNNGVTLRVPYYLAPQAVSDVNVSGVNERLLNKTGTSPATLKNLRGVVAGHADWYAWGIKDKKDHGLGSDDIRAVGAQSFPADQLLVFSIATNKRWSNASQNEFDIFVDVNNDGTPDYDVSAVDFGAVTADSDDGVLAVAVFNLSTGAGSIEFLADAPTDSSTMTLPVLFSQLQGANAATSLGGANQRFTYSVQSFSRTDPTTDLGDMSAKFNPFNSAVNTGMFDTVAPGGAAVETLNLNAAEQALSPALGWLVVVHENKSDEEAVTVGLK